MSRKGKQNLSVRRAVSRIVSPGISLSNLIVAIPSSYLLLSTGIGALVHHRQPPPATARSASTRFAICIPAHDEEIVIERCVGSLRKQMYPADLFEVHVVADNCTDLTAEVAGRAGATVHVRESPESPGKGPALNWLMHRLVGTSYDVMVIVDADTVADPEFLAALDHSFSSGSRAVQGYYSVLDPQRTPTVTLRYVALTCRHRLRPIARNAIGGSSGLYGNGMAFDRSLMASRRWSGHLVEDAEFQIELLLDGVIVDFSPNAVVFAEMPDSLETSSSQHERWELGRKQLIVRFLPALLRLSVSGGILPRRAYVDTALDLIVPPLSVLVALDLTNILASGTVALLDPKVSRRWQFALAVFWLATLCLHVLTALRVDQAPPAIYRTLTRAPRLLVWKLRLLVRVLLRPDQVQWVRTQRNAEGSKP